MSTEAAPAHPGLNIGLTGFHHVAIIASDYEKSKAFYTGVLGLSVKSETYRAERGSYKLDLLLPSGDQIELFSFPSPPLRPAGPEPVGLRHLAFAVADLGRVVEELVHAGVEVEAVRVDPVTQSRYTFFKDPDGLPLELYEVGPARG